MSIEEDQTKVGSEEFTAKASDSFQNFSSRLGIGTGNATDSSTYGFNPITRQRVLLEWMHRSSWLAGVAVDGTADDMTRAGVDITGDMSPDDILLVEKEAVRLKIWNSINEVVKWGTLYGGALTVMLIDGQKANTPFRVETVKKGQFKGLLVLDRWMVEPQLHKPIKELGPDMGLPSLYRITSLAQALMGEMIHHSRCVRFVGIKLPYWQAVIENMWGLSILERVYDRLIAFDSATTGSAQLVYKSYIRNYKIEGLRKIIATGGAAEAGLIKYVDMMRKFQGIEGMTLLDSADDLVSDSHTAFGGLSEIIGRFMEQCAGALRRPMCLLFGQSPSGFSTGDSDIRNYYDHVRQEQESELKVGVTNVYKAMAYSLGLTVPDNFGIEFRSLWQLTDADKSSIANTNVSAICAAEGSMVIDHATALKELKQQSKTTGMFTNITDEMIKEAEDEPPLMPGGEQLEEEDVAPESPLKETTNKPAKPAMLPTTKDEQTVC